MLQNLAYEHWGSIDMLQLVLKKTFENVERNTHITSPGRLRPITHSCVPC